MILFILSFITFHSPRSKSENLDLIPLSKQKAITTTQSRWYFIRYSTENDIKVIKSQFPHITINSMSFSDGYLILFLTPQEAQEINSITGLTVFYRSFAKSALKAPQSRDGLYLVQAHPSFSGRFDQILSESSPFYIIKTSNPRLIETDPSVLKIIEFPDLHISNRWTTGFLQSGDESLFIDEDYYVSNRKYTLKNLTGKNVIVTLIDTGADMNNCLLRDPVVPAPFNKTNFQHRKVVRYDPFVDSTDSFVGHGTHCAGIISGSTDDLPMSLYNGHAPGSRLYIADIGEDLEENPKVDLSAFFEIIEKSRNLTSPIISCSWGTNISVPEFTMMFDFLSYKEPNQLFVIAAGNDGLHYSIGSPADSKNALSVAASYPTKPFFMKYKPYNLIKLVGKDSNINVSSANIFIAIDRYPISFLRRIDVLDYNEGVRITEYKNKAVVIKNQVKNMSLLFDHLYEAEAKLAIVFDDINATHNDLVVVSCTSDAMQFFENNKVIDVSVESIRGVNNVTVAPFSSQGPSYNGNRKPDVMAPGFFVSSAGNRPNIDQCDVKSSIREMTGTSMATPAVSGSISLIYQYLAERIHQIPPKDSKNITSDLLRAFAIAASGDAADNHKGFGNINLSRVLLYPEDFDKNGLRYFSDKIKSNQHFSFFVNTDSIGDLSVSLAWIDLPLNYDSVVPLFGYLDLFVIGPDGQVYDCSEQFSTTKKIVIKNAPVGKYEIRIRSNTIQDVKDVIYYSLVVVGPFKHLDFARNPSELSMIESTKCSSKCPTQTNNAKCNEKTAECICDSLHTGTHCEIEIYQLEEDKSVHKTLSNREFWYLGFNIANHKGKSAKDYKNLVLRIESKVSGNGDGMIRYFINNNNLLRLNIPRHSIAFQENEKSVFDIPLQSLISNGEFTYLTVFNDVYADVAFSLKWNVVDTRNIFNKFTDSKTFQIIMITLIVVLFLTAVGGLTFLIVWIARIKGCCRSHHKLHHHDEPSPMEEMKDGLIDNAQDI